MKTIVVQLARITLLVLLAGLGSALLLRYSPGALDDERELDARLSTGTIAQMRADRARELSLRQTFLHSLRNLAHGDFGYSVSQNAPIAELFRDAAPVTLKEIGIGLAGAWVTGLFAGVAVARHRRIAFVDVSAGGAAALILSLPAALVAYACLTAGVASMALVLVLWPRVYRFVRNLTVQAYALSHVDMARARGLNEWRILATHVLPSAMPELIALAAASLSMAIGAAIPVEAICGTAGLGRLAWQAAMGRDLLLLTNLTMLIALVTTLANGAGEAITEFHGNPAR